MRGGVGNGCEHFLRTIKSITKSLLGSLNTWIVYMFVAPQGPFLPGGLISEVPRA